MTRGTSETAAVEPTAIDPAAPPRRTHTRVREGMSDRGNWVQLIKFAAVGASGFVVNLIVYEIARSGFDIYYLLSAVIAFVFAVTNNFLLNRYWTFKASEGHAGFQAARFLVVSLFALVFNLLVLKGLVQVASASSPRKLSRSSAPRR